MNAPFVRIREAGPGDESAIVRLIREFAEDGGEPSFLTEEFVGEYLASPGSFILLAEAEGQAIGLLSYSIQPDLYHAGSAAYIAELYVHGPNRGHGVGGALLTDLFRRLTGLGCVVASVAVMPDNEGALRLYQAHGLVDEAVFLERHF